MPSFRITPVLQLWYESVDQVIPRVSRRIDRFPAQLCFLRISTTYRRHRSGNPVQICRHANVHFFKRRSCRVHLRYKMKIFLCFVGLTFILTANAANRPVFSGSIAPQNLSRSASLSIPASGTTIVADDHNPNPDINFLATVRQGIEIGRNMHPSSHYPALVIGQWYKNLGPRIFFRYPQLQLLFQAPGTNWINRFEIQVQSQSYPTWGPPGPSELLVFPYKLWNWTNFNINMDLPEAWQRAQAAGWEPPLNRFQVERMEQSGEAWEHNDYYVFWGSTEESRYQWVTVDTVTGEVSFHNV